MAALNNEKTVKKGSMALYVILLVLIVGAMMILRNHIDKDVNLSEKNKDEFVVAMEYSPLSCYMYGDTLGGYSYDLLRMVSRHAGLDFKFQPMVTLSVSLDKLKASEYRMVCAEFPVTKENKEEYLFSDPIYIDRQVLVQRKPMGGGSVAIKSSLDLAHDTVWVAAGSSVYTRLLNLSHEIGDTIYVNKEPEYGPEQLFMRVATGEIKYAVMNERVAKKMSERYPDVDVSTNIGFSQFQSWIINKHDSVFCDSINSWLKAVKSTAEYKTLYNRYFSE